MNDLVPDKLVLAARRQWRWTGTERPPFAEQTEAGPNSKQESVWDYPRPPRIERVSSRLKVLSGDSVLAETTGGCRVLETSHPPTYYFPPDHVDHAQILVSPRQTHCEWKGLSNNVVLVNGTTVGWTLQESYPEFRPLKGWYAFYPDGLACFVDDVRVVPQDGPYYGGWVTPQIVGPMKGAPGSQSW
ncbi:MAG: DUF427 domain-containing protein [Pseudomonadota bacterium]